MITLDLCSTSQNTKAAGVHCLSCQWRNMAYIDWTTDDEYLD